MRNAAMRLIRLLQSAPTRRRTGRRDRGFSLVEMMLAMTVLGIGLLSIAQIIPLALAGTTQARVRTQAVQAGQERLDDLMAVEYDSLLAGTFSETVDGYSVTWTISDDVPVPGSKRIDLVASWVTLKGTQTVELTTLRSGD
jgi:prepilin-type N-terminal cleavage/methylation domain-containing protein